MGFGIRMVREKQAPRTYEQQQKFLASLPKISEDKITLMIVDPYAPFTYWGYDDETKNKIRQNYGEKAPATLRLKQSGSFLANIVDTIKPIKVDLEINVNDPHPNWYFPKKAVPNRTYQAEFGIEAKGLKGISLVKIVSNPVTMPRNSISNDTTEVFGTQEELLKK